MTNSCDTGGSCGCNNTTAAPTRPLITKTKVNEDLRDYWDTIYTVVDYEKNGWYEKVPEKTLALIEQLNLVKDAHIMNIGAGTTTLIDELLNSAFTNISATDISETALNLLKERLQQQASAINWIVDDLTRPTLLKSIEPVDLWIDRAVFHFFTEPKDQEEYIHLLTEKVQKGGYVILATFNLNGATKCSGLPVRRYNELMLKEKLKDNFDLIESFNYTYTMPSGDTRPYIYTLFKRK
ncbi:MAG: class I SAM-dependent methyltransferase [Flavobacteriales bacterium]|jgi:cyclopropane fatty-acyl-phospholipid synthase-like methyltransferase|nr:class I SAM-dependent methyltransferase [Flavobacteriales bacterium]